MKTGTYQINNVLDGSIYVGSALNIRQRWAIHRKLLRGNRHTNTHLQNAWNVHGEKCFNFMPISSCEKHDLIKTEQMSLDAAFAILPRNKVYNVAKSAAAPMLGLKVSESTKEKMRASQQKRGPRSQETRALMSIAQRGRKLSEEAKLNISLSKRGEKHPMWGKNVSAETKAKIADAQRGVLRPHVIMSAEQKEIRRKKWLGSNNPRSRNYVKKEH